MKANMDNEAIEEAAARWFARQHSSAWSAADQSELDSWLGAATAHRIAHIRIQAAWQRAARMKALGAGVQKGVIPARGAWGNVRFFSGSPPEAHPPPVDTPRRRFTLRARAIRQAALAAALLIAVGGGFYLNDSTLFRGEIYSTKVGALNTVPLSDGSRVTLNTNSHIRVELKPSERRIELDRGEAFFAVARDPRRPFVVEIGNKRVIAVGTQFSVRREHNDIRVAVTEGKVRVEDITSPLRVKAPDEPSSVPSVPGSADVLLPAGSVAQTAHSDILVNQHAASEVDQLLSWRRGYLVFHETALVEAVAEFNRYNTRQILIQDPSIADILVGGNFRATNTDAFLWLLQQGFPIAIRDAGDTVILTHR